MFETAQEASVVYGDRSLERSPAIHAKTGAWVLEDLLAQRTPRVLMYVPPPAVNQEIRKISGGIEKNDPFTLEDLIDNEDAQVQELIFRIRTSLSLPYRESLANRLVTLFNNAKQEDPASPGISVGSLRYSCNFFQLHANLKFPSISLSPENNIYASWRVGQGLVFSVHFLSSGDVRFVIFKPNDRHPERQIRISGTATADFLMETVAPYGVWDWISE